MTMTCSAISAPWSQVRDRRVSAGKGAMVAATAGHTAAPVWSVDRCTSWTYPLVLSTRVPIAD